LLDTFNFVYGPVPSRRLGLSLGISPVIKKTCNYSCIYCQLGRTDHMTNTRQMFFTVEEIIKEFDEVLKRDVKFDVVTIVGEGEPTLYLGLGELIKQIKKRTGKPVAVITNGALLYDDKLRLELGEVHIVLPSFDAYDEESFRLINRPYKTLTFDKILDGLRKFSEEYKGQIWIEIMLMSGINDDEESLMKYKNLLKNIKYDRLYINTPVRPPAEDFVKVVESAGMLRATEILKGISIDLLFSEGFHSEIKDDYDAILSIIVRHPMNQAEIEGFLASRNCINIDAIIEDLKSDMRIDTVNYKGYDTFRLK
jgi:wyosine [tRNA(Phe)-imidazoG37] synthetase (radical SAM superfamily)